MLPTPYRLGVKRRIVGAKDAHNKATITFSDESDWWVHGYAPGANSEPNSPNRDLSLILWTVYAPVGCDEAPGELDRVVIEGSEYAVEGRAQDFSRGPWQHPTAGLVVELKRPEG